MALALLVACLSTLIAPQPIANQPPFGREVRGRVIERRSRQRHRGRAGRRRCGPIVGADDQAD